MANVLIIDDDQALCKMLNDIVVDMKHDAASAYALNDGVRKALSNRFDVVLLDVSLPDGNGLDVLPKIQNAPTLPEIIIMTGEGDPDGAEIAIKSGAWDYLQKPLVKKEIVLSLNRVLHYREGLQKLSKSASLLKLDEIVGNSPQTRACRNALAQSANSDANILITGETGTGKELFAHAIHTNSIRACKNFVVVDCAALPETLVESTLFGHEKGAFTGADKPQGGLIKQADGGTLFLDEVGELPLGVQKSFLRVLQERRFRTVGGQKEIESDFRLVAATNRDLDQMVQEGKFRRDLLFRLRSVTMELPPLRGRIEDIKELALFYMAKLCDRYGTSTKGFSPEFIKALSFYSWPGNVRELVNAFESILATAADETVLLPQHLPTHIRVDVVRAGIGKKRSTQLGVIGESDFPRDLGKLKDYREVVVSEAEENYFQNLMSVTQGNIKQACQKSGLSRPRLYALLKKHEISRPI